MYIKDPYICFDNKLSSSGGVSEHHIDFQFKTSHVKSPKHKKGHKYSSQKYDAKMLEMVKQYTSGICSWFRSCGQRTEASESIIYGSRSENILCLLIVGKYILSGCEW